MHILNKQIQLWISDRMANQTSLASLRGWRVEAGDTQKFAAGQPKLLSPTTLCLYVWTA